MIKNIKHIHWLNLIKGDDDDDDDDDEDNELFLWYDQQKAFSLICSRDHWQGSSPSQISDTPLVGFEPAQNLSLGFFK